MALSIWHRGLSISTIISHKKRFLIHMDFGYTSAKLEIACNLAGTG